MKKKLQYFFLFLFLALFMVGAESSSINPLEIKVVKNEFSSENEVEIFIDENKIICLYGENIDERAQKIKENIEFLKTEGFNLGNITIKYEKENADRAEMQGAFTSVCVGDKEIFWADENDAQKCFTTTNGLALSWLSNTAHAFGYNYLDLVQIRQLRLENGLNEVFIRENYINGQSFYEVVVAGESVMRFYDTKYETAFRKADDAKKSIENLISQGGLAEEIKPTIFGGEFAAKINGEIIFVVRDADANFNYTSSPILTLQWINNLRQVLGAQKLSLNSFRGAVAKSIRGKASWYGARFHGRRTSSGERYDMYKYTAAHRSLPFGSWVKVTNLKNGLSTIVKINDRGPFGKRSRIIDLSFAAAKSIYVNGVAKVQLDILK